MSQLNVDSIKDRTGADQPDIVGAAKAFVNFNGTGTVTIRNGFNVSSITDNGNGDYTVNFTNAMVDANYTTTGSTVGQNGTNTACFNLFSSFTSQLTTSARVTLVNNTNSAVDRDSVSVAIHR